MAIDVRGGGKGGGRVRSAGLGRAHRPGAKDVTGDWQRELQGAGSEWEVRLGATLPLTPCTWPPLGERRV